MRAVDVLSNLIGDFGRLGDHGDSFSAARAILTTAFTIISSDGYSPHSG
jgi:hypothetical protein